MDPRLIAISRTRHTWHNATNNVVVQPLRFFYPETVADIQAIILEAEHTGLRVKAVGSGHSFSEVARCDDFMMDMKHLRNASECDPQTLKATVHNRHFVCFDAGITIKRLNRKLDEMGLALVNMGAVDFQTVSGALMTGTHGTGINKPAFPDMVRSLRIVGKNGKLMQIEPADGITDPVHHNANSDIELIQDDKIFYAAVLSFGAMGIVYQLIMEVRKSFFIQERRYLMPWSEVKSEMQSGAFMQMVEDNDFLAFRVNPYKIKGDHLCSIVVQKVLPPDAPAVVKKGRSILAGIFGNLESLIENTVKTFNRNPKGIGKRIQLNLKLSKVINYTDKSYKVLFQSGNAVLRYGISSEFAFEAKADKIIEVLEMIFEHTEFSKNYAQHYHPSHIPVRFVMSSEAFMSSCYGKKTCYIDIPTLNTTLGDFELLERYQVMMMKKGGVAHWGKVNNMLYMNNQFVKQSYPKWQDWVDVRNQLDPGGTFLNDFVLKMGLH